jgi:hypothetical protein
MTATNHTVTGMLILAAVPQPVMLVPAFLAHFVLDSLPHFGAGNHTQKSFIAILFGDMLLASLLLLGVLMIRPEHWPLIMLGGIACASPDLMWLGPWLRELSGKTKNKFGIFRRFHSWIQWGERTWGIGIEIIWFVIIAGVLAKHL